MIHGFRSGLRQDVRGLFSRRPARGPDRSAPLNSHHALVLAAPDEETPAGEPLDFHSSDADRMATCFKVHLGYDDVTVVKDATVERVEKSFRELKQRVAASQDSVVVVYYSGHAYYNFKRKRYYLCTGLPSEWIEGSRFNALFAEVNASCKMMINDSCHAGALANESRLGENYWWKQIGSAKNYLMVCSSPAQEVSPLRSDFTDALIRSLKGAENENLSSIGLTYRLGKYLPGNAEPWLVIRGQQFQLGKPKTPCRHQVKSPGTRPWLAYQAAAWFKVRVSWLARLFARKIRKSSPREESESQSLPFPDIL